MVPGIYFGYISRDWFWLFIAFLVFTVMSPLLLLFLSETPKFLYEKQRFMETKKVIQRIARINRKEMMGPTTYYLEAEVKI